MKPIGFDGTLFKDLGVDASFMPSSFSGGPVNPIVLQREGLPPLHVGTTSGPRTVTISFNLGMAANATGDVVATGNDIVDTRMRLLGALQPGNPDERVLVATIPGDGPNAGTEVEILAASGQYRYGNESANVLYMDFTIADDRWRERADTVVPQLSVTGLSVLPLYNKGGAPAQPLYKVTPAVQRATDSATVGWKWRRQVTIENEGTENWYNVRKTIDLVDTAAWVTAGHAQASGDDVRVRIAGQPSSQELPRTLTNFNSKRSWLHTYVTIPAGESLTLDIEYGNPSATTPAFTLSTRTRTRLTYAADDLEGTTGTINSSTTSSFTVSPSPVWEVDRWKGGYFYIPNSGRAGRIAGNTVDTITFNHPLSSSPTGEFEIWMSGIYMDGGRVTSIAGSVVGDSGHTENWGTNQLKGGTIRFLTGSANPAVMPIASNTLTTLTVSGSFVTPPAVNDSYRIERYGVLQYMVNPAIFETLHRGIYRINKYHTRGSNVWYGDLVPGGWLPWLMLPNQDDFAQGRYVDEGSGGGHNVNNWPTIYARRAVRSDNTWSEEGQADGVKLFDPRRFIGMRWDYRMRNEADSAGNGIGQVVILTQEPDGDDWQTIATDSNLRAGSLATVSAGSGAAGYNNFTGDTTPSSIYLGVLPADGVEIASTAKKNNRIELRTGTHLRVYLDLDDCGGLTNSVYTVGSEEAVYDLRATLRIGGGFDVDPPFDLVELDALVKADTPGERAIWINTDPSTGRPLVGLYSSLGVLVEEIPWAATITHHELDALGDDTAIVSRTLAPIPIGTNLIDHEDDATDWTMTLGTGVTATLGNDTGTLYDGDATSIKVTITATPAGDWGVRLVYPILDVIPGATYEFGLAAQRSSLNSTVTVSYIATWGYQDPFVESLAADPAQGRTADLSAVSTWYPTGSGRTIFAGPPSGTFALDEATTKVEVAVLIAGTGSTSGAVYLDQITMGVPNLYVDEDEIGELTVDVSWREAWHA